MAAAIIGFLAPLAELGISQAVIQAKHFSISQMATLVWVGFGLGLLLIVGVWLAAEAIGQWYGRSEIGGLLCLMSIILLVTPFGVQQGGLMIRNFRFDWVARIEVGATLAGFVLLVVLLWQGWGAWAMAASFVLKTVCATIACVVYSYKQYPLRLFQLAPFREVWPLIRFGTLDLGARWADFLANYLDKLIIGRWLGVTALGYYQVAFSLFILPTARLGHIITRVSYPLFVQLKAQAESLQPYFERVAKDVILVLYPVYLGIFLFAHEIILVLFGADWTTAAPVLKILAIAGFVRTLKCGIPTIDQRYWSPGPDGRLDVGLGTFVGRHIDFIPFNY